MSQQSKKKSIRGRKAQTRSSQSNFIISRSIQHNVSTFEKYQALVDLDTTVSTWSILDGLCAAGETLALFPQKASPQSFGSNQRLMAKLRLHYMDLQVRYVGAQSNILTPGDLHNTIRLVVFKSGGTYQSIDTPALRSVDEGLDHRDVDTVLHDSIVPLPSTAFSNSGYNVPKVISQRVRIPLNTDLFAFSANAQGTGAWETKKYDFTINATSDSNVTPHPQITYTARIYYTYL